MPTEGRLNLKKGLNVLIVNAHWHNRGDESAVRAMIDSLREKLPIAKMTIMLNVADFPYDDIEFLPYYPNNRREYLDSVPALLFNGKSYNSSGKRFVQAVREADVVIHAPGGAALGEIYQYGLLEYSYLYRLLFSKLIARKPVFIYAPSMGPFRNRLRNVLRKFVLKRADVIMLREGESARYLKEQLKIDSIVTADSALQNDIPADYLKRYTDVEPVLEAIEKNKTVGITITDLKWHPIYKKQASVTDRIEKALSESIARIIDKGYNVVLIPQIFGEPTDFSLLEKFRSINRDRILILPGNIDSYGQQVIISKMHSFIGMRYHSNIFAAKGKVPFVSIYYEHKMKGFMSLLGLAEMSLDVESIDSDKIIERFEYLEKNYAEIRNTLEKHVPELQRESRRTSDIIVDWLSSHGDRKII